jgi:hypothetical protein
LLLDRAVPARVVLGLVVPSAYGFVTGIALDKSKGLYIVLVILAAIGGVLAGFEMYGSGQGALRGVVGGTLFGGFLLIGHAVIGGDATVKLPDPEIVYLAFTIIPSAARCSTRARASTWRRWPGPMRSPTCSTSTARCARRSSSSPAASSATSAT